MCSSRIASSRADGPGRRPASFPLRHPRRSAHARSLMGFRHSQAAYALTLGNPGRKATLIALASRACENCGICWPGVTWIMLATEMSERSTRRCLTELAAAGHIVVRRYPQGGRGVATEYLILPTLPKLLAAPCPQCLSRMRGGSEKGRNGLD